MANRPFLRGQKDLRPVSLTSETEMAKRVRSASHAPKPILLTRDFCYLVVESTDNSACVSLSLDSKTIIFGFVCCSLFLYGDSLLPMDDAFTLLLDIHGFPRLIASEILAHCYSASRHLSPLLNAVHSGG